MHNNTIFGDSILGSKYLQVDYLFNQGIAFFRNIFYFFYNDWTSIISFYHVALFFIGLFFLTIISYCTIRMFEIRKKEHTHLEHEIEEYAHHNRERERRQQEAEGVSKNERWVKTLSYLFSQHASDWKLAVIEADSMLESLLGQLGMKGETLGDKLKSADPDKFRSLTTAWEVHTVRNRIAHEGMNYELSQHEAKRVISLYEQIFRQYGFI